ncbi:MAG TPA: diacylglycerol kinase family protein [Pseudogracilibacillus sp.]|nr:diacylglycerol kinase family protein [Pseudogracilibacillus sp.]
MYNRAILIYNGNAGQTEVDNLFKQIIPILTKGIKHLMLSKTEKVGDAEIIAREYGADFDLLISLGGDGTLHEVINGIAELETPPLVAILPAGTCNDFARSLNLPLNMEEAAENILKGEIKSINIGKINERYFTNFVGTGLITQISDNINPNTKNLMGKISYYTAAVKTLKEQEDFHFKLTTENETIEDDAAMIVILNGTHVGSTFVPVKSIDLQDNLFDIFIVYDAGLALLMKYITQKENFEDQVSHDEIKHFQAKNIKINTQSKMEIDTDGEIYLKTPIEISVLDKNIQFITGKL